MTLCMSHVHTPQGPPLKKNAVFILGNRMDTLPDKPEPLTEEKLLEEAANNEVIQEHCGCPKCDMWWRLVLDVYKVKEDESKSH